MFNHALIASNDIERSKIVYDPMIALVLTIDEINRGFDLMDAAKACVRWRCIERPERNRPPPRSPRRQGDPARGDTT